MSRLVQVRICGVAFAGIERANGTLVLADHFAPDDGATVDFEGRTLLLMSKRSFERELGAEGLQPVWSRTLEPEARGL